jgi:T5SS/PEP-CTERM-associated repeat protein/autotransporter-associated beta strand protein
VGPVAGDRKATLEITGGASVSSVNGIIYGGTSVSRTETVTVSGVGSTWTNSGSLTMAAGGFTALNINNGGLVVATALKEGANSGLALDGGTLRIISTGSSTNLMALNAGGGTLDIPTTANTFTMLPGFGGTSGIISGVGGLTKTAAGTLAFAQANTYGGGTTINGGKLLANNTTGSATGNGNVAVNTGGTLGGTGTVSGAVSVAGGGTVAPGASIGTLNTGAISLTDAASKLSLELNLGATPAADLLNVTGSITLANSTLDLALAEVPLNLPTMTFLVAANDASDAIVGTFATINGVPAGYVATVNYAFTGTDALGRIGDGNDLAVTFAVPEPTMLTAWTVMAAIMCLPLRSARR